MCVFPSSREPTRRQTLASPSRTAAYLLPKNPSGRLWLECRPELRNHGVGWMRAVERLRNGGVPRNPVFLMPATHCTRMRGGPPGVVPLRDCLCAISGPGLCVYVSISTSQPGAQRYRTYFLLNNKEAVSAACTSILYRVCYDPPQ